MQGIITVLWLIYDIEAQPYDVYASNWENLAYSGRTIRSSLKIANTFNTYQKDHMTDQTGDGLVRLR